MLFKMLKNDLKENKIVNFIVFFFLLLSSFLLTTVFIVSSHLFSSIDSFSKKVKTPDFLQMHIGDIDQAKLNKFSKEENNIKEYQILNFLNIDFNNININGDEFKIKSQDNGFSYQSEKFDFLIDLNNEIVKPKEGEVYVPLVYLNDGYIKEGDTLSINDINLKVIGGIRDSQMSSMLSSSKRFLVNKKDYYNLEQYGRTEYLIEYMLNDRNEINKFQAKYQSSGLPSNGPTITYSIIRLINALTEGIILGIMVLVSILIILISLLCINFILNSKLEDDSKVIGVFKAIGIQDKNIKRLYWFKYIFLAFISNILGYIISLLLLPNFLKNIKLYYGLEKNPLSAIYGFIAILIILFIVFVYLILFFRRINKLSPAKIISNISDKSTNTSILKLRNINKINSNLFMSVNKIFSRKKLYISFFIILILLNFLMILPRNIYNSINSDKFIEYMGFGNGDLLVELDKNYDKNEVEKILSNIKSIDKYEFYTHKNYDFYLEDNIKGKIYTSLGNQSIFKPKYISGREAKNENEINISYLNHKSLEKNIGDNIVLIIDEKEKPLEIVGIYSDITNGGKTAKASFTDNNSLSIGNSVLISIKDKNKILDLEKLLKDNFSNTKIFLLKDFKNEILGSTLDNINKSSNYSLYISLFLMFLISYLFNVMILKKDNKEIFILKSLGFYNEKIKMKYLITNTIISLFSMLFGFVLTYFIGGKIVSLLMEQMGIYNFTFSINWIQTILITPILVLSVSLISSLISNKLITKVKISNYERG